MTSIAAGEAWRRPGHELTVLRRAHAGDADGLAATARRAYLAHYADLWNDGAEGYAGRSFAALQLAGELADPRVAYWIAERGGAAVGFMKCVLPRADAGAPPGGPDLYLERLYFEPAATGGGAGAAALRLAADHAFVLGLAGVWLRAMADRPRVIGFYQRHGYVACGTDRLAVPGVVAGRERMLRMLWRAPAAGPAP